MPDSFDSDRISADEQRLAELLRAVEAPAPPSLQALIAEFNEAAPARRRLGRPPLARRRRRPALALGGAFATAALAAVLIVVLVGGTSAPTALRTAQLALAQPRGSAPARLVATGTQIAFPDWAQSGWPRVGVRHDSLGGRDVTTEFYRAAGATIGYSIVSGAPLRWGYGTRMVVRADGQYRLARADGASVVAWVQQGHTCVIASRTAPASTLLSLAVAQDSAATVSAPMGWNASQYPGTRA